MSKKRKGACGKMIPEAPKIKVEPGLKSTTRIKVEPGLLPAAAPAATAFPSSAQVATAAQAGCFPGARKVVVLKSSMLKGLNQTLILNKNKVPKDQKTQTYARSISDFPTPTDALMWYLEGEKKAASDAKRQNEKFIGSMVPLLHPSVDDTELRTCLYTLRKIQDEMHKEVNHLLEVISTLNPADDAEAGRLDEADEEPCSSSMATSGNSSRSTASAGSSRLFPGNSSSIPPPSAPSTSASAPDGVDFSLLDRIGAGICGAPDEDKLPDPSDFLAGNDDDDDGDGKEAQDESDNDDEMDYDGSTQELLANVDCLLTTDGGNGSQDPGSSKGGPSFRRAWDGMLSEDEVKRVLRTKDGEGGDKNVSKTHMKRRQISELLDANIKASEIARIVDCGPNTIRSVVKMKKEGKSLTPNYKGGSPRSVRTEEFLAKVASLCAKNPDMSKRELARKMGVSAATVARAMGNKE